MIKFISFGKITGLHGVKGEVVCDCFFENYEYFLANAEIFLKEHTGNILVKPKVTGVKKGNLMLQFDEFQTVDEARKLLKKDLLISREALDALNTDEDENEEGHFVADLLELKVFIEGDTSLYGLVKDVVDFGGGAMLEVEISPHHSLNKNKKEKLEYYEKRGDKIKEINLEKGYIAIFAEI